MFCAYFKRFREKWRGIKRSYKKIQGKIEEIRVLFNNLTGDYPNDILREILSFINPVEEYLTPLIKDAVTNMRELKELYCSEHDKLVFVK